MLGYQGRLLRADGTAATGAATLAFTVFGAETGGSPLWTEAQTLGLSDGYYSTFLGLVNPPGAIFDAGPRWVEIKVGSETLSPRQQIGGVAFALTAQSVSGGTADVASLKVRGQVVVDADGRLSGAARYAAGAGIQIDDTSRTVSLEACPAGQYLVRDTSAWHCSTPAAGTVTDVMAVLPLAATGDPATPSISMAQSGASASGYLSSDDWNTFSGKYGAATQCGGDLAGYLSAPVVARLQSRAVSASAPSSGQVLKWSGSQWEPAPDLNSGGTVTGLTALAPLTVWNGSTTPQISIVQASPSADGYLASADWSRFDAKYEAATQCGGDLSGALSNPLVTKLQGVSVSSTVPGPAQVLRFDGAAWAPASLGISDVGGLSTGYVDLTGSQSISGAKTFTAAPTFSTPLGVASGGIGASAAAANAVFAGPDGSTGAPGFRALSASDIPSLDASKLGSGLLVPARGGTGASSASAGRVFAGPITGTAEPGFRLLAATDIPSLDASAVSTGTFAAARIPAGISITGSAGSVAWADVTDRPGTIAGYGISDAFPASGTLAGLVRTTTAGASWFAGGNFGVGTTSPARPLDVSATALNVGLTGPAGQTRVIMGNRDSAAIPGIVASDNGNLRFGTGTSFASADGGTMTETLYLGANHSVGIGTVNPGGTLDIGGNLQFSIWAGGSRIAETSNVLYMKSDSVRLESSAGAIAARFDNGSLQANGTGSNYFAGNVGIGKTPATALDVNGTVTATTVSAATQTLVPQASAPSSPTLGMMYVGTDGGLRLYTGRGWIMVASGNDGTAQISSGTVNLAATRVGSARPGASPDIVAFNPTAAPAAGATTITLNADPTGLSSGDDIVVYSAKGPSTGSMNSSAGNYELNNIASISARTITLAGALTKSHVGMVVVQRVPRYSSLTVASGATLTAPAWNGSTGGLLVVRVDGTATVNGTISMNAAGYRGGAGYYVNSSAWVYGYVGESACSDNTTQGTTGACGAGGGGMAQNSGNPSHRSGGGGGGYGTAGTSGTGQSNQNFPTYQGAGGTTYGAASLAQLFPGAGGGGSCTSYSGDLGEGPGGAGGGVVYIVATTLLVPSGGLISADGAAGIQSGASSGGGAGGSVRIEATTLTIGTGRVTASGGAAYGGTCCGANGGPGGAGRIALKYTSIDGGASTTPAFAVAP